MNKCLVAVAFCSAAALALPVGAADALITRLSSQRLSSVLLGMGAKDVEITKPKDGIEVVSFNDGTGIEDFVLSDCTADGCQTLQMTIVFDPEEGKPFSIASVNGYNGKVLNAQAAVTPEGRLLLADLFVTNGGVTEANLKENIGIFLQAPDLLARHMSTANIASANPPAGSTVPVTTVAAPKVEAGIARQELRGRDMDMIQSLLARPNRKPRHLP
jgi:hypothetical protein